jgi:uncharacterized protein YjhX (UPF0386 family)
MTRVIPRGGGMGNLPKKDNADILSADILTREGFEKANFDLLRKAKKNKKVTYWLTGWPGTWLVDLPI